MAKNWTSLIRIRWNSCRTMTSNGRHDGTTSWNRCRTPTFNGSAFWIRWWSCCSCRAWLPWLCCEHYTRISLDTIKWTVAKMLKRNLDGNWFVFVSLQVLRSNLVWRNVFSFLQVHGDVFRPPRKGMLLSVLLGSGTQVFCMTLVTLAFACLGFLSPANRGALMTCAMVLYVLLGTPAGYVSARIYKSFGGFKWKSNVLLTSTLCPG